MGGSLAAFKASKDATELWENFALQRQYFLFSLGGVMRTTHWELFVKKSYFSLLAMLKTDVLMSIKCFDEVLPLELWFTNYMFYNFFF